MGRHGTIWIIFLIPLPLLLVLLTIRRQPMPKRGVSLYLHFEDRARVLEPVDNIFG